MLIAPYANFFRPAGPGRILPRLALAILISLSSSFPALAFDLDELSARLAQPAALQGRFEQRSWLEDQQTQLHSEGSFLYQRGIRVLWQMETPESITHAFYADMTLPPLVEEDNREEEEEADLMLLANRFAFAQQFAYLIGGDWETLSHYYRLDLDDEAQADAWQVRLSPLAPPLETWLGTLILEGGERLDQITLKATNGDELIVQLQEQRALVDIGLLTYIRQWFDHRLGAELENAKGDVASEEAEEKGDEEEGADETEADESNDEQGEDESDDEAQDEE